MSLQVSTIKISHTCLECNGPGSHWEGSALAHQHQEGGLKALVAQLSMAHLLQHWIEPRDHRGSGREGQVLLALDCILCHAHSKCTKHLLATYPPLFNSCAFIGSFQWQFPFCFKVNLQLKKKLTHFDHFTNSSPERAGSRVIQIWCTHQIW